MSQASPLSSSISSAPEQLGSFTLRAEHLPARLSHGELHHPMPILDMIRAIRTPQEPRIHEESKRLVTVLHKYLAKLGADHIAQHRFLILAQSAQLALSLLHSASFRAQLQAHFSHSPAQLTNQQSTTSPHHAAVVLCYPAQEQHITPGMVQHQQQHTECPGIMAHIFTPEEVDHIAKSFPKTHTPQPNTKTQQRQPHTMKLRSYLARNAGDILASLRRALVKDHYHLPKSILDKTMHKLDAAALHLARLNPAKIKHPGAREKQADLACLHTIIYCASSLNCTALYNELIKHNRD